MMNKIFIASLVIWLSLGNPMAVFAQEAVDAAGNPTGTTEPTGATECTGASCTQGMGQGENQGLDQGSDQGLTQGTTNGVSAGNTDTGADSNNQNAVNANTNNTTAVNNNATDTTNGTALGNTGGNANSMNTGNAGITSGNAGIGVTQVKNDNTAVVGGQAGLDVSGHNGDYNGDLNIGVGSNTADLNGSGGPISVQAVNDTTGANSTNSDQINTTTTNLTEVQNDGLINNILNLGAVSGQNKVDENTGNATVNTGNANVAATLVNLLNNTVIDGNLWVTVADIFGNLTGNINLPDFASLAALLPGYGSSGTTIDASNQNTGSNSDNTIAINQTDATITRVNNDADINTTVNVNAITGQNTAEANTGGGSITTGTGSVAASNISVANTTIEGGNWVLALVNAANRWLGFLVGDNGQVQALSPEETLRQIQAKNANTGADSTNTIAVNNAHTDTTSVNNDARINNDVTASAITGQNDASMNTGAAAIATGDASVKVNAINIANTTVKHGSLLIAVVNIFGDWFGDLMYGGHALASVSNPATVAINADNSHTGSDSTNTIDVNIDRTQQTQVHNQANVKTTLNANIDTGSNKANHNTNGAGIKTGDSLLALHSRAVANLTGITLDPALGLSITGLNDTTGANSENIIRARLNDQRIIDITNLANVSTIFGALTNTGNNEASGNTIGGNITTGDAAADVGIHNLINQVLLALGAGGNDVAIDADFMNRLTGALSHNTNDLTATRDVLTTILNRGLVANLIDLLLNTGGNKANDNTVGGNIATGDPCVTGSIDNQINKVKAAGKSGSFTAINDGQVINSAGVTATSGDNTANNNTSAGMADGSTSGPCHRAVAVVPTPSPEPLLGGSVGGGETNGGEGGGEEAVTEPAPRVAAAQEHTSQPVGAGILQRFPVAGGRDVAVWLAGRKANPWYLFALGSIGLVAAAWHLDRRSRRNLIALPA